MMTALSALTVNAYRELQAKKLFWLTLIISLIVVVVYASIGFNETGMFFFFGLFDIESEWFREGSELATILYRDILFSESIARYWLGWAVIILALIATSSIFPDTMSSGTIDLTLSKPISRVTLFSFKFFTGLLFMLLQTAVFCAGVFLALGWRIGDWNWMVLAPIPILTLVYSYLFAVNVLIGVITRSALAALLLTILLWFIIFVLHVAAAYVDQAQVAGEYQIEQAAQMIDEQEARLQDLPEDSDERAQQEMQLREARQSLDDGREMLERVDTWVFPARVVQTILPKTGESTALIKRWLASESGVTVTDLMMGNVRKDADGDWVPVRRTEQAEVQARFEAEINQRSLWYIIGTSLIFEGIVLFIAGFIFCRRDF